MAIPKESSQKKKKNITQENIEDLREVQYLTREH